MVMKTLLEGRRRMLIAALLLTAPLLLGGCVYLRFVQVKRQLATPERTVTLDHREGLSLTFADPILYPGDIRYLVRRTPTRTTGDQASTRWTYRFCKQPRDGERKDERFDVPVDLHFVEGRLSGGRLPERFGRVLDPGFILETLRAIGRSRVDLKPRAALARASPKTLKAGDPRLPSERDIVRLFGRPFRKTARDDELCLVYRYRLKPGPGDPKRKPPCATASFTFLRRSGRLVRAEARFAAMTLNLLYPANALTR